MEFSPDGDPVAVLVVEDHEDGGESLADVLQMHGYQAWLVRTGREAIRAAELVPPAVVLLDLHLPDGDGWEVGRRLRAARADGRRPPRVVAVTGCGRDEDRRRSAAAGIDLHLVKPVDPRDLLEALGRLARGAWPSRRPPTAAELPGPAR